MANKHGEEDMTDNEGGMHVSVASSTPSDASSMDDSEERVVLVAPKAHQKRQLAEGDDGREDQDEYDDDELSMQQSLMFPSARLSETTAATNEGGEDSPTENALNEESRTSISASSSSSLSSSTQPVSAKRAKRQKTASANVAMSKSGSINGGKIPAARRRFRLDPEAQRQQELLMEQRARAQDVVNKALYDDFGHDREFLEVTTTVRDGEDLLDLQVIPSSRLRNELLEDLLALTRTNMRTLYDGTGSSAWHWSDNRKRGELRNERMRWIILRYREKDAGIPTAESGERGIVGFAAFRFTCELGIPHAYLHELQVWDKCQGKGFGQLMMATLQRVAEMTVMQLIILTVFSKNIAAIRFYDKLGFSIDEASPGPCYNLLDVTDPDRRSSYEIMSKVLDPSVLQYKCDQPDCEYKCRFPDTLQQHAGYVHGAAWPHPCCFPGCTAGTVHLHQLQKHNELKHSTLPVGIKPSTSASGDLNATAELPSSYVNTRVTFKSDGRRGTVIKLGDKGFYTVRMDGPTFETVVCRAGSFLGHHRVPVKKKVYDPDHELALKLQYEDGWARKSSRINRGSSKI